MTPEEARRLIQAELDGLIEPAHEAALQQFLGENPELAREYAESRQLATLLRADRSGLVPDAELSQRVARDVLVRARREGRSPAFGPLRFAVAAAVLLLLCGASFWVGKTTTQAGDAPWRVRLDESRARVLEEHPDIDAAAVDGVFRRIEEQLRRLHQDREQAAQEVWADLELEIRRLTDQRR